MFQKVMKRIWGGYFLYNYCNLSNRIKVDKNNHIKIRKAFLNKSKISVYGKDNRIDIDDGCNLNECDIKINGNNNKVFIDKNCKIRGLTIHIEDSGNSVYIGHDTTFSGQAELAAIEGTSIIIGDDCMFAPNVQVRTGDSHSMLLNGERYNMSKSVTIGSHVWIAEGATLLKGTIIYDNSVIGTKSLCCSKDYGHEGVVIAGNPARVVKSEIEWKRERI